MQAEKEEGSSRAQKLENIYANIFFQTENEKKAFETRTLSDFIWADPGQVNPGDSFKNPDNKFQNSDLKIHTKFRFFFFQILCEKITKFLCFINKKLKKLTHKCHFYLLINSLNRNFLPKH